MRGVWPLQLSPGSTDAPAAMSTRAAAVFPECAQVCSAVSPRGPVALALTPAFSRRSTMAALPLSQASAIGVVPYRFAECGAAPARSSLSTSVASLFLTAIGSAFYHLDPSDMRLVWDRLPIALACAGLLAAVRAETHSHRSDALTTFLLAVAAVLSVMWWDITQDLRPYLLIQTLPLVLIPVLVLALCTQHNSHGIASAGDWAGGVLALLGVLLRAGVVGYVDFSGNLDTAIAIRTMFVGPNGALVQAGAGIVADSDPAAED